MAFQRDLAWQNLDLLYQSSIAHQLARYTLSLNYELLPQDVVHQCKRSLLDTLGCAVGAYVAPGRPICEALVKELGGPEEATVFGSGLRTSAPNATLVNSFLVRFLDYNDSGGGGHNSDSIPSILAIAEREKASGRDFLTAVVVSYEIGARVRDSIMDLAEEDSVWTSDIRGGLCVPPALGKLMGLTEQQIANAIGICASHSLPLGVLDANTEELTMAKNFRFGLVAYHAILSCMLAKKGFTGPVRVVEGELGFRQVIFQGAMDLDRLVDFSGWRILNTRHKILCTNGTNHGNVLATLAIVTEHDLKPADIASVRIKTTVREAAHTSTPAKKYPRNAESADHSTFYANAFAIKERSFGPESIEPKNFTDPVILDLIEKITIEADPSMTRGREGMSVITTKDGRQFEKRIDTPHGFGDDPLTDGELEDKFRDMGSKYMGDEQIQEIFDTVWNADRLDDVNELTRLMVFPSR